MSRSTRSAGLAAAVAALGLAGAVVAAPGAQAGSAHGCPYPYACVYSEPSFASNSVITARYKVVTGDWQYLTSPQTGFSVWNTRNDDVVYVLYRTSSGAEYSTCVTPNTGISSLSTAIGIRISYSSIC
jgi:hypothetical protein